MLSQKGIEANPKKIKAILEIPFPKSVKDIQRLAGRMAVLSRVISKSVDKWLPFFKLLRNSTRFVWDDLCEKAFTDLETYLSSLILLVSSESSEWLYLYLVAFEETLITVLTKKTLNGQFLVYYVNKELHNLEFNYSRIEKLTYILLMASCKLRQYFQNHHIIILTDQPLQKVLQKMTTSSRMVRWNIKLNEYSLDFLPRQSVKAQSRIFF